MHNQDFHKWLKANLKLSAPSLKDIASRAERAKTFTDLSLKASNEAMLLKMNTNSEFSKLSPSVKSQVRQAARLYRQFKSHQA